MFSVMDGHGLYGHLVSQYIKKILPQIVGQYQQELQDNASKIFFEIYEIVNEQLNSESKIDLSFSGSTSVSVLLLNKTIYCSNVGDSRAIIAGQDNNQWNIYPLSRDHKPSLPDEDKRIIQNGGRIDSFKSDDNQPLGPLRVWLKNKNIPGLAMTRSFGDLVAESVGVTYLPEIQKYEITKNDKFILIASDGIWEYLTNIDVCKIIVPYYNSDNIEEACDCLLNEAILRWHNEGSVVDDITFILIFLNQIIE